MRWRILAVAMTLAVGLQGEAAESVDDPALREA